MVAVFLRLSLFSLFLALSSLSTAASAATFDPDSAKPNLPKELEKSLTNLLEATPAGKSAPDPADINMVLRFVTTAEPDANLHPESRDYGSGIFYKDVIRQPLRTLVSYILDPAVPGEALYPSTVRRNVWQPGSEVLKNGLSLAESPYPPAAPLVTRGVEYEETTPDTSSGCYYSYKLDRLFVLTGMAGRTALLTVSLMPKESSIGLKGVIVDDNKWEYVYTPVKGTNISMLNWAETYLYGSATVTVFIEPAAGSKTTDVYVFKWAKAGWSGMNVVKPSHILAGVKRYLGAFKLVMEAPGRPTPQSLAAWASELAGQPETALREGLAGLAGDLERRGAGDKILSQDEFQAVLKNGGYASSLSRENAVAEALKLRMRKAAGLPAPTAPTQAGGADPS